MASGLDLTKDDQFIKTLECSIYEVNTSNALVNKYIHSFCSSCLAKYASTKVQEGEVLSIKCPAQECSTVLEPEQIKSLLPELYSNYEEYKKIKFNESNTNFRYRPRLNCPGEKTLKFSHMQFLESFVLLLMLRKLA